MSTTTFEEAKQCPMCAQPGEDTTSTSAPGIRGARIHHIYCRNEKCTWYNTPWMVQVNADGSVPPKRDHRGEPKQYVGFEDHDRIARDIRAAVAADEAAQRIAGNEITRRGLI